MRLIKNIYETKNLSYTDNIDDFIYVYQISIT